MINLKNVLNLLKWTKSITKGLIFTTLDTSQLKQFLENIYSANPLYLVIGEVNGHFEEKMGVNI